MNGTAIQVSVDTTLSNNQEKNVGSVSHSSTILLLQYLKAITFDVLNVRCGMSTRNENKFRSNSQEQNFLLYFFKIYCRESMYIMFKDKLQNCSLNKSE